MALSTCIVLSAFGQYFSHTYFKDMQYGSFTNQVIPLSNNEIMHSHKYPCELTTFCGGISKIDDHFKNTVIFNSIDKEVFLNTTKIRNDTIFYSCRDIFLQNGKYHWYFGKMTLEGESLGLNSYEFNIENNSFAYLYGMEIVKDDEIILWGTGNDPMMINEKNDPRVIWIRVKMDGTLVSGPHYYKPDWIEKAAQPSDATVDIDGNMVFVYDYATFGFAEKYIFKILENDSILEICRIPLNISRNAFPKIAVTHDGHYIVTNYDTSKKNTPPLLTKLDRQGNKVWESSFDLIYGPWSGFNLPTVDKFTVARISEARNGDILMCGFNAQVDTFYVPFLKKKVAVTGWTGTYMARFGSDGTVKWVHFLASVKDNGTFRKIDINDIQEMDDGSIVVGGSLGVLDTLSTRYHSWVMKVGPNGCFDETCSHVDKWWFFPEEIAIATEEPIINSKLNIYPNPGDGHLSIDVSDDMQIPLRYELTAVSGQLVIQGYHNSRDNLNIETSHVPTGMYFIRLVDKSGKLWQSKWVKI